MSADTEKLAAEHLVAPEATQVTRGSDAAPPQALQQAAAPEIARLGDRFLAQAVDALVGVGVFFFVGDLIAPRFGGGTANGFDLSGWPATVVIAIVAVIMLAYFILAEHWTGATLGKVVAGIRVLTPGGQHIDLRASLYRNLMRIIDVVLFYLVGAIAILATTRRQRLGDIVAHSVVVVRNTSRASQVGALVAALAVFLGGIAGGNWMLHHAGGAAQTPPVAGNQPQTPPTAVTQPQTPQGAATQAQTPQGTTGQPRISTAVVSDNKEGNVEKTTFSPTTGKVHVVITLADVPAGTPVKAVWIAENVEGIQANKQFADSELKMGGAVNQGDFYVTRPEKGWPVGVYRVELYLAGQLAHTANFRVQGQ